MTQRRVPKRRVSIRFARLKRRFWLGFIVAAIALRAVQSFAQTAPGGTIVPPDVATVPGDEYVELVPATQCGRVTIEHMGLRKVARGHLPTVQERDAAIERLSEQGIDAEIELQPWPQCEVSMLLAGPLSASDRPAVRILSPGPEAREGEDLVLEVQAPQAPTHLHVAYLQADGRVVHLVQTEPDNLKTFDPGQRLTFGDGRGDGTRLRIAAPFGPEMIVALASRSPLFEDARPATETDREFLAALRRELALRQQRSDLSVRAAITTLVTRDWR